jgi:hypothetical protein
MSVILVSDAGKADLLINSIPAMYLPGMTRNVPRDRLFLAA